LKERNRENERKKETERLKGRNRETERKKQRD
jgi:hypothetical protein